MSRIENFTFRVNRDERMLITAVAARLQRNESDTLRYLVRKAAAELETTHGLRSEQKETSHTQHANT